MFIITGKFVAYLILFITLFFSSNAISIEKKFSEEEHQESTMVIGVTSKSINPSLNSDSLGVYWGVNIDYLRNISKILNIDMQLKYYYSVVDLLKDVENGIVDGTIGFTKTPERAEKFLFSNPIFKSSVAIWFKESFYASQPLIGLKWTCVRGTSYCEYLRMKGIKNIQYADNFNDSVSLMNKGIANAFISSFVMINEYLDQNDIIRGSVVIPNWFEPEEISFITAKDRYQLLGKINEVLEWEAKGKNIRSVASNNLYHINDKLLSDYRKEHHEEPVITYSSSDSAYPFFSVNSEGDEKGFLFDLLGLIQSRSGLQFEYIKPVFASNNELATFNADIVPVAYVDRFESPNWLLTKPFMEITFRKIEFSGKLEKSHRKNNEMGILLSLRKQGVIHVKSWGKENFKSYSDIKKLIDDLKKGIIQSAYISDDVLYSLLSQFDNEKLKVVKNQEIVFSLAFSVINHDIKLKKLLDSIIDTIDVKEIEKLNNNYKGLHLKYGYDSDTILLVLAMIFTFIVIASVMIYFFITNMKLKIRLAEMNANNEEKEKQWLTQIIQELNSKIFIHDEEGQLILSNCSEVHNGKCKNCTLIDNETKFPLVDHLPEIKRVLNGERINDYNQVKLCHLDMGHVYRERQAICSLDHNKKFVLTVIQDVTEQKQRERELIRAQYEAQSAVKVRERFLATMSHELRTPLSATYGLLDLVATNINDEKSKELILCAKQSLNHLNALVDEVLDYSKLEAGELQINPQETDLLHSICQILRGFETRAVEKGLHFEVDIEPFANRLAKIDDLRLNQIMSNLLSNAIKFTNQGTISVTTQISSSILRMTVTDSGIGMSDEQLEHVFKPFVQADNTITRQFGGTGLGLSIVKQLIDRMGGEITITSQPMMGTQIDIFLPIESCEQEDVSLAALSYSSHLPSHLQIWCQFWGLEKVENNAALSISAQRPNSLRLHWKAQVLELSQDCYPDALLKALVGCVENQEASTESMKVAARYAGKVLVAEDNKINQHIVKMQFDELGIIAVIVDNGKQALDYLTTNQDVTLVLTDFHMPEMDGYELVRKLRTEAQFAKLPVVGVTAEDSRIAREKATICGINEILYKPYDLVQLQTLLGKYLPEEPHSENWLSNFLAEDALEIANVFVVEMKKDLEQLQQAQTTLQIETALHKVKGACGAVGLHSIANMCELIEQTKAHNRENEINAVIEKLQGEIAKTLMWMGNNE
ncbi:transporter substrate-binding domain-containing protein [Vibrio vulnificus]|nr:transporter substrate-binding domain-containing protein [Vibrio vulnificus]